MRPVLNLVQTPQAATIKGIFFFIKVCQLGYSDNSILCQYRKRNNSKKRWEWEQWIEGAGVWQKRRQSWESGPENVVISFLASHRHWRVSQRLLRDFSCELQWFSAYHLANRGRVPLTSETLDFDCYYAARPCQREESGSGTNIQVY